MATQAQTTALPVHKPTLRERLDLGSGFLPYYLVAPAVIVIALVAIYPILDSIRLSFLDNPLSPSGGGFAGLGNYGQVIADPFFRGSIVNTLIFSVVSVALESILGLGIAILMNGVFPGRGLVRTAILIPFAFPTIISGQIWLLMYNDQTGIVTYLMQAMHILAPGDTLLRTPGGLVTAAIITDVWKTTPFMALLLLAGLQVIPNELYEAAGVDGSTRWQQFWLITVPMLRNPFLIALMFRFLDALRVFDLFYIFTGGGREVQTMALYAYSHMFQSTNMFFASGVAAAVLLFILCAIVSLILVSLTRLTSD